MNVEASLALLALVFLPNAQSPTNPEIPGEAVYHLRMNADAPRVLHIDAELPSANGRLSLGEYHPHPENLPWPEFVDDLTVTTLDGEPVSLERSGSNMWSIEDPAPERVRVRYRLRLEHDAGPWPPSHAESTYAREDCVFFRGYAVLIANRAIETTRIVLDLPEAWRVTTPLARSEDAPREHFSENRFDLLNTGFLIGTHATERIQLGEIEVDIGVSSDLPGAIDAMAVPFRTALVQAREVFGGDVKSRYAIIASSKPGLRGTSGSGLSNGMAVLLGTNPVDDPGGLWTYTITHELLHMWLGSLIRGGFDGQWFNEGMADYLAMSIAGRHGLIRRNVQLGYIGQMWNGYLQLAGDRSMTEAGQEKTRFYNFLYGGGMHIGLLLDIELRRATDGDRSINDLMQAMNGEFGATGEDLDPRAVERIATRLAGEDLGWIFEEYVFGTGTLPSELVHAPVGLMEVPSRNGGVRLGLDPDATPEAIALRKSILGID